MKVSHVVMIALGVVVLAVLVKRAQGANEQRGQVEVPTGGPSGSSQQNVPPYAGQGTPVPVNPILGIFGSIQAEEWAMA